MCGIKPCATCNKTIGKMAKKKIRRRRRVGAIKTTEAKGALRMGAFALVGSIAANVLGGVVDKDNTKKYIKGVIQTVAGIGLALTSNKDAQSAGVGMLVVGGNSLLKDAGVKMPGLQGLQGVGFPHRLGMPSVPSPMAAANGDLVQY
jgi:hypothetical protein